MRRMRLGISDYDLLVQLMAEQAQKEDQIVGLTTDLTRVQSELDSLRAQLLVEIDRVRAEIAQLNTQITSLGNSIAAIQAEIAEIRALLGI